MTWCFTGLGRSSPQWSRPGCWVPRQCSHRGAAAEPTESTDVSLKTCQGPVTVTLYLMGKETGRCARLILCLFNLLISTFGT